MRFALKVDGTMEFDELPQHVRFAHYDMDGKVATPKYACPHRQGRCAMSPCGKRPVFRWRCNHFGKAIDLTVCKDCDVRES